MRELGHITGVEYLPLPTNPAARECTKRRMLIGWTKQVNVGLMTPEAGSPYTLYAV